MSDLIDRQAAIETTMTMCERCTTGDIIDLRDMICESLAVLPTADTDLSEYSDRLWKTAYERGKAEGMMNIDTNIPIIEQIRWERDTAIEQLAEIGKGLGERMDDIEKVVRCKDCKHNSLKRMSGNTYCDIGMGLFQLYDFCSLGERRTDAID